MEQQEIMNDTKKPSNILIRTDMESQFFMLTEKEAGQVIRALLRYANTGELPTIKSRPASITFEQLRQSVDIYNDMYVARCEKNRAAVEARWKKRKEAEEKAKAIIEAQSAEYEHIQPNTNVYERIQSNTNEYECILLNKNKDKVNQTKDKVNEIKLNTLSSENITHTRTQEDSTDIFAEKFRGREIAIENAAIALHTDKDTIIRMLDQFVAECKAKQSTHLSEKDFSAHYVDWLRIQLEKKKSGSSRKRTNTDSDINEEWK